MGKRSREDDDDSIASSQDVLQPGQSPAKIAELDIDELDTSRGTPTMQCFLPPHPPLAFDRTEDFDVHYLKEHTNRCLTCGRNFPSAHYLALHLDENHNPVRESLAANGEKTYACFIETCEKLCSTPQKRRLHLVDKHMFPKTYDFRIVDKGIDKKDSMLTTARRRRLSTNTSREHHRSLSVVNQTATTDHEVENMDGNRPKKSPPMNMKPIDTPTGNPASDIGELTLSMASLEFIPPSVQSRQRTKRTTT